MSFDSDFANILNYPPQEFFGIIRLTVRPLTIPLVLHALALVVQQFKTQKNFRGKLIIAEPSGLRVWEKEN